MLPGLSYEEALVECILKTLRGRKEDMCINLIKTLLEPCHKLHDLLPPKVCEIRNRKTRLSGQKFYNFRNSSIVYGIEQFNKT